MTMELMVRNIPAVHVDTVERTRIEKEIEGTKAELEAAEAVVTDVKAKLIGMCQDEYIESLRANADFNDMAAEIQELRRLLGIDEDMADMLDEAMDKMREDAFEKELEKITERNREKAKALFRKISRLCHPDVCDDTEKHELFVQAREAYGRAEVSVLESILKFLLNTGSLPKQFMTKIEELLADLNSLKARLNAIKSSAEYNAETEEDYEVLAYQFRMSMRHTTEQLHESMRSAAYTLQYLRNVKRDRNV